MSTNTIDDEQAESLSPRDEHDKALWMAHAMLASKAVYATAYAEFAEEVEHCDCHYSDGTAVWEQVEQVDQNGTAPSVDSRQLRRTPHMIEGAAARAANTTTEDGTPW